MSTARAKSNGMAGQSVKSAEQATKRAPKGVARSKHRALFCERLKAARIAAGYQMPNHFAKVLGVSVANYLKYESRSYLPHYLLMDACSLLNVEPQYFYTGERRRSARSGAADLSDNDAE